MIKLYKPTIDDLWFKQALLSDEETMSFNHAYGGTINFPKEKWKVWYDKWFNDNSNNYYRYLVDENNNYIGEIAYYLDNQRYIISIIIHAKYRNKGYGKQALQILCEEAKKNGIDVIYDDIAIDNTSTKLFYEFGFVEVDKNDEYRTIKKILI